MPRADDPRVVVRMSADGYARVKAQADRANVGVAAILRIAGERLADAIADEVVTGQLDLRRSSIPEAATGPADVVPPTSVEVRRRANPAGFDRQARVNRLGQGPKK
jgi:hypothetical protein